MLFYALILINVRPYIFQFIEIATDAPHRCGSFECVGKATFNGFYIGATGSVALDYPFTALRIINPKLTDMSCALIVSAGNCFKFVLPVFTTDNFIQPFLYGTGIDISRNLCYRFLF